MPVPGEIQGGWLWIENVFKAHPHSTATLKTPVIVLNTGNLRFAWHVEGVTCAPGELSLIEQRVRERSAEALNILRIFWPWGGEGGLLVVFWGFLTTFICCRWMS